MTDKKLTDEEIIKALEGAILNAKWCDSKVWSIEIYKLESALDLINRQKAEIERLENALLALMNYLNIIGCDKSDVSFIKIATDLNKQIRADIKSQSVKEFAERLKKYMDIGHLRPSSEICFSELMVAKLIDNFLKEMVGEEE